MTGFATRPLGWRGIGVALAVFAALAGGGCSALNGFPPDVADPDAELQTLHDSYFKSTLIGDYKAINGATQRRTFRDEAVYGRMRAYDITFLAFMKSLSRESGGAVLGGDVLALTLSSLGATVGNAGTKAALATASGGVIGLKGDVSKELFYEKTMPAIIAQMQAQRAKVRAVIETGLVRSDDEYSLPKALIDLNLYEEAGSLPGAISGIVQNAGTETVKADHDVAQIRGADFVARLENFAALRDRVAALSDSEAIAVAKTMQAQAATRTDQTKAMTTEKYQEGKVLTDGKEARRFLMRWVITDDRTPETQRQWTDAIVAAK
jgi:hypothetical protein